MDIDINTVDRTPLFRVTIAPGEKPAQVSPPAGIPKAPGTPGQAVPLDWTNAIDDQGTLKRCPVCQCDELFTRRDFPQRLGLTIVVLCAIASVVLFFMGQIIWCMAVLLAAVVADRVISLFTGKCIVCYRCRSEFRNLPIPRDYPTWDLSTGEKYRDHSGEAG